MWTCASSCPRWATCRRWRAAPSSRTRAPAATRAAWSCRWPAPGKRACRRAAASKRWDPCRPASRCGEAMIDAIIEAAARNKLLVLVLVGIGIAGGLYSIRHIPLDAIPDLSDPQVIVYTEWPGRSPDLVEDQVTY